MLLFYIVMGQGCIAYSKKVKKEKHFIEHDVIKPEWIKIEDFESVDAMNYWTSVDTENNTNPILENPQVTEIRKSANGRNRYLIKKPAPDGIVGNRKALSYRKLPRAVEVGEIYTFYTRINVEYFPNNHVFGLSSFQPEEINIHNYNAFEPSLRITDKRESDGYKNDGTLMVRKGNGYAKIFKSEPKHIAKPLQPNTWYEIWYVVNNAKISENGQQYDVYVRGGNEFADQNKAFTGADFRMKLEKPLIYFLANCNTGPLEAPYGNGGLRFDDLYMAAGEVLSTPKM